MNDRAVIVPVYNEGNRAIDLINNILKHQYLSIIVVNDGSVDDSEKLLKENFGVNKRVMILNHIINLGKGAAMKTGVKYAWNKGIKTVVFIDSDGQHNPKLLTKFFNELRKVDLVFGYRKLTKEMPFIRKWGNMGAKWLLKMLFGLDRKEFLCGYLGFNKKIYKKIKWTSSRYGVETEIATKVSKNKLAYKEILIDTIYVDKYKGVSLMDAVKVLFKIPLWYFSK